MLLEVRGLVKRFGGLMAVCNVDFTLQEGHIVSLIGPNGAGKSTTFDLITGVQPPDQGSVRFSGQELVGLPPHRIARLGIARTFQDVTLFSNVSVRQNVVTAAQLRENTEAGIQALARECLSFVGLGTYAEELAVNLSHGHQALAQLAVALACRPRLLLLDEPMRGMNPSEKDNMSRLVRQTRARGTTVLLVEHDMRTVMAISDTVVVLNHGQCIAAGSPEQVRQDEQVIRAYLGSEDVA